MLLIAFYIPTKRWKPQLATFIFIVRNIANFFKQFFNLVNRVIYLNFLNSLELNSKKKKRI